MRVPDAALLAFQYWRMLPLQQRTERELRLCLKRHSFVDIDAQMIARDLLAAHDDVQPYRPFGNRYAVLLSTPWEIVQESEGPAAVSPAADTGSKGN